MVKNIKIILLIILFGAFGCNNLFSAKVGGEQSYANSYGKEGYAGTVVPAAQISAFQAKCQKLSEHVGKYIEDNIALYPANEIFPYMDPQPGALAPKDGGSITFNLPLDFYLDDEPLVDTDLKEVAIIPGLPKDLPRLDDATVLQHIEQENEIIGLFKYYLDSHQIERIAEAMVPRLKLRDNVIGGNFEQNTLAKLKKAQDVAKGNINFVIDSHTKNRDKMLESLARHAVVKFYDKNKTIVNICLTGAALGAAAYGAYQVCKKLKLW